MTLRTIRLVTLFALLGALAGARPAAAQSRPSATVAGGYSFLRSLGIGGAPDTDYSTGWFASASHRLLMDRLAAVGELSLNSRQNLAIEDVSLLAVLGGARFSIIRLWRFDTFVQALVGLERFKEPGFSDRGFALQPGLGVDIPIVKAFGVRAQVDYRIVEADDVTVKAYRAIVGGVVSFGER